MKDIILIIICLILFGIVWGLWSQLGNRPNDGLYACTEDARVCPDGTVLSRVGPSCEFPACPGE